MNLLHLKYALAIAESRSINKAAEELLVGAPALSRAIKELETDLGTILFDRSARGMTLTPDGEQFMGYAKRILKQVDDVETMFRTGAGMKKRFSISVPRASYIAAAFAGFSKRIDPQEEMELFYKETNAYRVIHNLLKADYQLGILRYAENYESFYHAMMKEKGLTGTPVTDFSYVLVMNERCPLAQLQEISFQDLNGYIEIAHADPYVPSMNLSEVKKEELPEHHGARVFVFERGSQFDLLVHNPRTYMWVSPLPEDMLSRSGLVVRKCVNNRRRYRDVLVCKENYQLTELDRIFIEELEKAKKIVQNHGGTTSIRK